MVGTQQTPLQTVSVQALRSTRLSRRLRMDSENRATFVKLPYIRPARQRRSCEGCYSLGHMARAWPPKAAA
jgi:hypothetical protein